jgi:spore germination cell wall hydrolase CwlJ-like protein
MNDTLINPISVVKEVQVEKEPEIEMVETKVDLYLSNNTTQVEKEPEIERVEEEPVVEPLYRREVTDEEYKLLLRVCMSETGGKYGEPIEGKVAVVETILNRVDMGYGTITEVINEPYQYSTANNGEPDETVIEAVELALTGDAYPDDMLYFRTKHYHNFGTPYKKIGDHYFSCK